MSTHFRAVAPATGAEIDPVFTCASAADINAAATDAAAAFEIFADLDRAARASFLRACADQIDAVRAAIVERAALETGLAPARLEREIARTTGTFRAFAAAVEDGSWIRAAIDHPTPGAEPGSIPARDLRRVLVPLGPVAVFGASNFPLAYGVGGGDTASALAAGCTVVVKGHPSHPGTGEIMAEALSRAVAASGLPRGVFSYLHSGGDGEMAVGEALVKHPSIAAVGFTGSVGGGMALVKIAAARERPIPVFAEMGSTNPVVVLPNAATSRGAEIAAKLAASILESSGQQCTCPGQLFMVDDPAGRALAVSLSTALDAARENLMLSRRVRDGYLGRVRTCAAVNGVACTPALAASAKAKGSESGPIVAPGGLLETTRKMFSADAGLREEIFGPAALVVWCRDADELCHGLEDVPGTLTGTIWSSAGDEDAAARVQRVLMRRAGRIIFDGVPTGVRVAPAMVHSGPLPACNRPDTTAVGAFAIERWTRPVCFQNAPAGMLPAALLDGGAGIRRLVDGEWSA